MAGAFIREDGERLRVLPGLRDWILTAPRASVQPKPDWTDDDYVAAARRKVARHEKLLTQLARFDTDLRECRVLDVGCGAGIDTLLIALHPARQVVGVDLEFPLFAEDETGEGARRLAREVLDQLGIEQDVEQLVESSGVRFEHLSVADLPFEDESFDLVISRAALEHVSPLDAALAEMRRVSAPDGLQWHTIDPFFWLKGCHKGGLVDIPWAHARLSDADYRRFVTEAEGAAPAEKRSRHLATLNQVGLDEWRGRVQGAGFEILRWREDPSLLAQALLEACPDVATTLLPHVHPRDLTHSAIKTWLRPA